jgi:hypothetical protein
MRGRFHDLHDTHDSRDSQDGFGVCQGMHRMGDVEFGSRGSKRNRLGDFGDIADPLVALNGEESNALDYSSNPQLNPQHAMSCAAFKDLGGPWQSPRSCKLL